MRKFSILLLVFVLMVTICSCGSPSNVEQDDLEKSESVEPEEISFSQCEIGDEISVTGQKANATLVNENTIWVQVTKQGERTVVYHCQLKPEFLEQGEVLSMLDVVSIKGCFMSVNDMAGLTENLTPENTAIIVTLYDCEIV